MAGNNYPHLCHHVLDQCLLQLVLLDGWHANTLALIDEAKRNRNRETWVLNDPVWVQSWTETKTEGGGVHSVHESSTDLHTHLPYEEWSALKHVIKGQNEEWGKKNSPWPVPPSLTEMKTCLLLTDAYCFSIKALICTSVHLSTFSFCQG